MPRKARSYKRHRIDPDPKYNNVKVAKFINHVMQNGKKSVAQKVVYAAFEQIKKAGFARVRVDGTVMDLNEAQSLSLDKQKKHSIDVVVDRLTVSAEDKGRI